MNKFIYVYYFIIFNKLISFKIPKVSIIIPSYNILNYNYLKLSINSVLNQTLKNIELIVVDDNASDQTPIILDNYAFFDSRITIVHKRKNEMTGYARNTGLDFIMGEYLGFLDYDDIFHKDALRISYHEAKKKNLTIVNFNFKKFRKEKNILKDLKNKNNNYKTEILRKSYFYPIKKTSIYIWCKIYKSSFILYNNFKFTNTWCDEDVLFCMTIFSFEFEILLIKKPLVFHRLLKSSISHNVKKLNIRQKLYLYHLRKIFKIFKKNNLKNNRIIENIFVLLGISHFKKKNIEKLLRFLKCYNKIFTNEIIRKYYIKIYKFSKLKKLYFYKENNISKYEITINKKLNCYI